MGSASSKGEKSEALRLCKERKRFIKEAIDSRFALAASHSAYIESLRNIGVALTRYAEAEIVLASSATGLDKTPSHFSYPSPSLSHLGGVSDSPVLNGSPLSPPTARMSYMMSGSGGGGGGAAVTVRMSPVLPRNMYVDDSEFSGLPPPPPPPPDGSSWDFFEPGDDDSDSFRFMGDTSFPQDLDGLRMLGKQVADSGANNDVDEGFVTPKSELRSASKLAVYNGNAPVLQSSRSDSHMAVKCMNGEQKGNGSMGKAGLEQSVSRVDKPVLENDASAEREDPSEFITHRAKDFISSIRDIEHRFFRASESGKEISRMLEANKIHVGFGNARGKSPVGVYLASLKSSCCHIKNANVTDDPEQSATKVITWKRTTSSRSSSSRNPLTSGSKDDNDDSGSDFMEEFCMISGSHSSTLDRLYAWERKLYDEVKASETIRKDYDRKCSQLRHQFAKDLNAQMIDKTRAVVKDLHSRITVGLHAVDSISKRIERMRDEEMLPQLLELIQGLIKMWKVMLECHHSQYITITLAYLSKTSEGTPQGDAQKQIILHLQDEVECFGVSFADWINSLTSYVEALNNWLQNCILQPQERTKGRRPFSPRRYLAPPIFVLCRDLSAGIKSLPSEELSEAIRVLLSELRHSIGGVAEEPEEEKKEEVEPGNTAEPDCHNDERNADRPSSNLNCLQTNLTKVFDRLTKFSEASLKMYEDVKQKSETARSAYLNYRPPPRSNSI